MSITYIELTTPDQLHLVPDLEGAAWGRTENTISVPVHMHRAILHSGGNMFGAFDGDKLVGFTLALPARRGNDWILWSHMTGIHPEYQRQGMGTRLKYLQRDWSLAHGYSEMGWTFDPLQRGNANLNICRLGGHSRIYHIDFYGELADAINKGMPTDRLELTWNLEDERVRQLAKGEQPQPFVDDYPPEQFLLRATNEGTPKIENTPLGAEFLFVEIPYSINGIRQRDMALVKAWRLASREVFQKTMEAGYRVADFHSDSGRCWYILRKD